MRKGWKALLVVAMGLLLAACSGSGTQSAESTKKEPVELHIQAAASMTEALNDLKKVYEEKNDNVTLTISYGASGALAQQIEQGVPADLFISAAQKQMDDLVGKNLVDKDSVTPLLKNKLVLITAQDNTTVTGYQDLLKPEVSKVGLGDPASVPVGQYSEEVYTKLNLWEPLQSKFVLASDVKQVLTWVESKNVDAGTVYETDAKSAKNVKIVNDDPGVPYKDIVYPIGVVTASKEKSATEELITFFKTEDAKKIFNQYGFTTVNE